MNQDQRTFQTDHPTIKEITIGDRFITHNGDTVVFVIYKKMHQNDRVPFGFVFQEILNDVKHRIDDLLYRHEDDIDFRWYCNKLFSKKNGIYDINRRYIPLKDKIDLL
jgi:hypothetical protein